jgi:hypothetical protein
VLESGVERERDRTHHPAGHFGRQKGQFTREEVQPELGHPELAGDGKL